LGGVPLGLLRGPGLGRYRHFFLQQLRH
jgi:hypothetical protein